jgi:hypothetical protein
MVRTLYNSCGVKFDASGSLVFNVQGPRSEQKKPEKHSAKQDLRSLIETTSQLKESAQQAAAFALRTFPFSSFGLESLSKWDT